MKKYSLRSKTPDATDGIPISDGAVFLFILSRAAVKNIWRGAIFLRFVHRAFCVSILESKGQLVTQYFPAREGDIPVCTKHYFTNTNIVVKMEKSQAGYSICIDGAPCHTLNDEVTLSGVSLLAYHDQSCERVADWGMTLLVFDETELGEAERIAQAMQNGNMEDEAENEKVVTDRELVLDAKEKALEQRELKILKLEKALELRLAEFNAGSGHGGGSNVANSDGSDQTFSQVQLPDADAIRLSATQAWPKAVKYVLKSSGYTLVKTRHDILMNEWVEAKGNNISPNSYDYFVFSLGVGWPKAVRELTTDVNLAKIREKQDEYMDLLIT